MNALMNRYAAVGLNAWKDGAACRKRVRDKLGSLIGCDGRHIGLTQNTSHGLIIAATEFPWRKGDGLVLFRGEFPGNATPWLTAAQNHDLKVHWLNPQDLIQENEAFRAVMAQKPALMAISQVQYQTGQVTPLDQLSRIRETYGVCVAVDVIQGLGPLTMDLRKHPLDFIICGGHKWLLSPEGTGFIYVNPQRMKELKPALAGWLSQEDPVSFLFRGGGLVDYHKPIRKDAQRFEMGTMNNFGYAGMEASLDMFLEVGPAEISRRILERAAQCREGLHALGLSTAGGPTPSGNVSFPLDADSLQAAANHMEEQKICISTPDGHLRVSAHFYNDKEDIAHYLREVKFLLETGLIKAQT